MCGGQVSHSDFAGYNIIKIINIIKINCRTLISLDDLEVFSTKYYVLFKGIQ